ncbi:hypothetical protein A2U01_0021095, partial [Trifolium medium]|nr:hypothetical protein [Trifolium medium]
KFSPVNDVVEEVISNSSLSGYSVTAGNKVAEKWVPYSGESVVQQSHKSPQSLESSVGCKLMKKVDDTLIENVDGSCEAASHCLNHYPGKTIIERNSPAKDVLFGCGINAKTEGVKRVTDGLLSNLKRRNRVRRKIDFGFDDDVREKAGL